MSSPRQLNPVAAEENPAAEKAEKDLIQSIVKRDPELFSVMVAGNIGINYSYCDKEKLSALEIAINQLCDDLSSRNDPLIIAFIDVLLNNKAIPRSESIQQLTDIMIVMMERGKTPIAKMIAQLTGKMVKHYAHFKNSKNKDEVDFLTAQIIERDGDIAFLRAENAFLKIDNSRDLMPSSPKTQKEVKPQANTHEQPPTPPQPSATRPRANTSEALISPASPRSALKSPKGKEHATDEKKKEDSPRLRFK